MNARSERLVPPHAGGHHGDGVLLAEEVAAWLRGEADMVIAAMGRRVPLGVQLGVLAHAPLDRLRDLGRYGRRGSVRRAWGTEMAQLAGDIAAVCRSEDDLDRLQADVLVPLELDVVAGRREFACRQDAITYLRGHIHPGPPEARSVSTA